MSEMEPEIKSGEKKKDFFWVIVVIGVVAVIGGAILTGNFLAKMFIKPGGQTEQAAQISGGDYSPPDYEEAGVDLPKPDSSAVDESSPAKRDDAAKNVATVKDEKAKGEADSTEKTDGAAQESTDTGSSITFTDVEEVEVKKNAADNQKKIETEALSVDEIPDAKTEKTTDKKPEQKVEKPAQTTEPSTPPAEGDVIYVLQLGMYSDRENADRMKASIDKDTGLQAYIATVEIDGAIKYRVQVGAFRDKENADKLGRELQIKGYRSYTSPQPAPKP